MRFYLAVTFLVFGTGCRCGPLVSPGGIRGTSWLEGTASSSDTVSGAKKRDGVEEAYLEQCGVVKDWKEDPGLVKVLTFLDPSKHSSHRQAAMLKVLRERLERSGITGVRFVVVSIAESVDEENKGKDEGDVEAEREAWASVPPPDEQFDLPENNEEALKAFKEEIGDDISLVRDTIELRIWDKLHASEDQVIVLDRCGRLSYQIIFPWSLLHFPYVKAAVLSTYKDQPCGECEEFEGTKEERVADSIVAESISEEIKEPLNITRMKEIATRKYNLQDTDSKPKKHHGTEYQDIPENIIRLLNGSAPRDDDESPKPIVEKVREKIIEERNRTIHEQHAFVAPNNLTLKSHEFENSEQDLKTEPPSDSTTEENIEDRIIEEVDDDKHFSYEDASDYGDHATSLSEEPESKKSESVERMGNESTENEKLDNGIDRATEESSRHESSDEPSQNADYVMPIRIIMRAPHVHYAGSDGQVKRSHEFLVLKMGNPGYHGHLDSGEKHDWRPIVDDDSGAENIRNDYNRDGIVRKNNYEKEESEAGSGNETTPFDVLVYGKDESPGFYGEDATYWRNCDAVSSLLDQEHPVTSESSVAESQNQDSSRGDDTDLATTESTNEDDDDRKQAVSTSSNRTESFESDTSDEKVAEITKENTDTDTEIVRTDDDTHSNLVVHYSQLLPWLYYVLED